jgi:MraZ protein
VELQRSGKKAPILTAADNFLELHPYDDWCAYEREMVDAARIDPRVKRFVRLRLSNAVDCPIDKQGRILVPEFLRKQAKLEHEAMIVGVGPHIELWDKARFDEDLLNTQAHHEEIALVVAKSLGN